STPHGGGGPGSGPVGVKKFLEPFLPTPRVIEQNGKYHIQNNYPQSIGRVKGYFGNFGVNVRAYAYIKTMGAEGREKVSESAVLHANYLKTLMEPYFDAPYQQYCMHEFVMSGSTEKKLGVRTLDMAKRLLDFGFYAPTVYFPLIVPESLMIEPTETEPKETIEAFADAMIQIAKEAEENPEIVQEAPHNKSVRRLNEVQAARKPVVTYQSL